MRALALVLAFAFIPSRAGADPNEWSVDVGYRGIGSIKAAGDGSSTYAQAFVSRIENTMGRWFVGAVLAVPLPGLVGQSECSIAGGIHHVIRRGVCARGDSTELFCGHSIVMDYALETGVAGLMELGMDKPMAYYGPLFRPRVTARMLWPTRGGNQVGIVATVGVAAVWGITSFGSMTEPQGSTVRLEPAVELSGVYRF
jgi:hypothetical protein